MNASVATPAPFALHRLGNVVKTFLLLAAMSALTLLIGQRLGGPNGLVLAGGVVLLMNAVTFWFSDRIALAMTGAKELPRSELPWLHAMVDQLAARADLPRPRLYLVHSATPNAFATGRSPKHAAIAVTTGLLELLARPASFGAEPERRELMAVLAHELSHVRNRDTLTMTIAGTLAGLITQLAQFAFFWGAGRDDDESPGASLGLLLVAPLAATLLQLAVSRSREFDADAAAAQLTHDPLALANALARLESGNRLRPMHQNPATAHLFIVNPLAGGGLLKLFATHPPIEERIERLVALRG